jgi:hypothetical protein
MEHPTAERSGPLPPIRYTSGTGVTGYPLPGDLSTIRVRSWSHPGAEARRRHLCLVESLGSP